MPRDRTASVTDATDKDRHDATVVDQHTRQADGYARLTAAVATPAGTSVVETLQPRADDRLLDLACGPGRMTRELAPHVSQATGLDLTPAMLEQARAAEDAGAIPPIAWVQGDAAALPFEDDSFTLVTCGSAFHHFAEPSRVLGEMVRVCARGGRIVVIDVAPAPGAAAAYDAMERRRDPSHRHAHPVAELTAMAREHGLADPVVRRRVSGPMPYAAVLATSFPQDHTREDLLAMMRDDAVSGEDRHGFSAALQDGEVMVSYPMATLVWAKA